MAASHLRGVLLAFNITCAYFMISLGSPATITVTKEVGRLLEKERKKNEGRASIVITYRFLSIPTAQTIVHHILYRVPTYVHFGNVTLIDQCPVTLCSLIGGFMYPAVAFGAV